MWPGIVANVQWGNLGGTFWALALFSLQSLACGPGEITCLQPDLYSISNCRQKSNMQGRGGGGTHSPVIMSHWSLWSLSVAIWFNCHDRRKEIITLKRLGRNSLGWTSRRSFEWEEPSKGVVSMAFWCHLSKAPPTNSTQTLPTEMSPS